MVFILNVNNAVIKLIPDVAHEGIAQVEQKEATRLKVKRVQIAEDQ